MSPDQSSPSTPTRSPILAAIGISLAIAAGSIISTLDMAMVEDAATGKWLTRPLAEAQQRNTLSIASLENTVGAISKDIDFVSSRVSATIRRSEDQTYDRFAHLDAEIAALKDRIAGVQHARFAPGHASEQVNANGDITGLRSSLHDLATAHTGAIAAVTRRLDRIETKVGLTTDMISSGSKASAPKTARFAKPVRQNAAPAAEANAAGTGVARPERGHMFNVKPISQQGLRLSRLPG